MLSAGMLVSSLTLLPFLPVSVLFCLSPLVSAAWLWLLFWDPCPPGVLATVKNEHRLISDGVFSHKFINGFSENCVWGCFGCGARLFEFLRIIFPNFAAQHGHMLRNISVVGSALRFCQCHVITSDWIIAYAIRLNHA